MPSPTATHRSTRLDQLRDWIASQPATQPPDPGLEETDLLSINYTSGTTARPKGVTITHRNAYINAYNFIAHLRISQDDAEMWTLPMFHANGWGGPYAITAMGGKHVVLRAPEAADIYQVIQDENCTFACMAPAVLARILEFERKDEYNITVRPDSPSPERRRRNRSSNGWRKRSAGSSSRSTA